MDYFLSDAFQARAEALIAKYRVPGLAIAITHRERIESRAFGLARLEDGDRPSVPCTPDTLFDIASASKSMTAASAALLVADDKLPDVKYDAVVADLLPGDFVMPTEELTREITLDDILSHRTGMPTHDWSYLGPGSQTPDTPQSVTRNLRNLPVCAPLRTKYMYNNMMYTVLTYLVEQKTNMSFADFLTTKFFQPLDMSSSTLQPSRARARDGFADRMASGYTWVRTEKRQAPVPMVECPEADGAGSIITSVNDYIKWMRALLHRQTPVTEAVYNGLLRARTIVDPDAKNPLPHTSPSMYCAGFQSSYYRSQQRVEHSGGITGFATKQLFLPAQQFGCVVTANSSEGGHAAATVLYRELIDEVLGVPQAERTDWEALADAREAKDEENEDPARCEAALRKKTLASLANDGDQDKDGRQETGNEEKDEQAREAEPQPLTTPLETYAGTYENPGYHQLLLEIKDGKLFVDASERSFGFTGVFNHVAQQRLFTLRIAESQAWGGQDMTAVRAEFAFQDAKVTRLGLALEPDMEGTDEEMIWFTRK